MAFTFFMRDQSPLEQAADHLIPFASGRSRIKIWDAGCAHGQETYTFAMILAEKMNHFGFKKLSIHATDYDSANRFGETVTAAAYSFEELKFVASELFTRYFEPADRPGYFRVVAPLRERVTFLYHDLLSLNPIGCGYSLVVCKNVLPHFQHEQRVQIYRMFYQALAPGGYLVTETSLKLPHEVAHLFSQVVPDAKLFKKVGE